MDRLVHHAHRFELQGESMRKKRGNLTNDFLIEKSNIFDKQLIY